MSEPIQTTEQNSRRAQILAKLQQAKAAAAARGTNSNTQQLAQTGTVLSHKMEGDKPAVYTKSNGTMFAVLVCSTMIAGTERKIDAFITVNRVDENGEAISDEDKALPVAGSAVKLYLRVIEQDGEKRIVADVSMQVSDNSDKDAIAALEAAIAAQ